MRIFTIGETTFDILFRHGQPSSSCSGGSAYNSAISLGRCGLPISLISTFGNDPVGDLSYAFLTKNGVNCNLIKRFNGQSRIALAFIDSENNADYSFYQASEDVFPDYPVPQTNDILLLGSSFALRDNGREELIDFLQQAQDKGCITIYDPNARQSMVDQPETIRKILKNISLANIIKGSDQDFRNIFGLNDSKLVYSRISESGKRVLIYTKGTDGAELFAGDFHLQIPALPTKVISTIGAGDNFSAGIVYGVSRKLSNSISDFMPADWEAIMSFGALFASEVCGSAENYIPKEMGTRLRPDEIQNERMKE